MDDDHARLAAGAAEAGLVEVSLPLDLATELADGGLAVGLDEETERDLDGGLFGGRSGGLHGLVEQNVVDFDVSAHGRAPNV